MKIRIENTRSKLVEYDDTEHKWLDGYLTFEDSSRFFAQKKRRGWRASTDMHLLDKRNNTFPSGLVSMIRSAASEEGFAVAFDDARRAPCEWDLDADLDWLYQYQFDAVLAAHRERVGILHLPTGSGKTEIACGLIAALPCYWLFLAHKTDLMHNAARRWKKRQPFEHEPGICGDGEWRPDPERRLTVATYQTVVRRFLKGDPEAIALIGDAEGIIVDECHVCPASSFQKITLATRRAYFRIGLSGTPLARGDKRSVLAVGALGPVIYKIKPEVLIRKGVLARPVIRAVPLKQETEISDDLDGGRASALAYSRLIAKSTERNALVVDLTVCAKKPALVFVRQVDHGHTLTTALRKAGLLVEFVWGTSGTARRDAAIRNLRNGDLDVVVCSVIFQEGIDVPELEAVVNAAGMKSTIATLQRLGRGMRSDKGRKTTFEVWEVKDEGNKYTKKHANARLLAYRKEGYEIEVLKSSQPILRVRT